MNSESGEASNTISTIKCANPVRPDPPIWAQLILRIYLNLNWDCLPSCSTFGSFHLQFFLWPSSGCLPFYSVHPVILRPVAPAEDPVVGLPSPGALENPAGMSRTLSCLTVTGESDPLAVPSNSGASSWNISYECCASAGSTSMGWDLSMMLSTANATSASVGGYQDSSMVVTSWMPSSSSIVCLWLATEGVWYLATASCSSGVLRWVWVNPGGTLSASVGCQASGCLHGSWSLPAHDGVVKLRSEVSWTSSRSYVSHRNSTVVSSGFCMSGVGPGSDRKCSLSGGLK